MGRKHALLAPSSASRWLVCGPSARANERYTDSSSAYADEGTLAHELAELLIKVKTGIVPEGVLTRDLEQFELHELYSNEMYNYCDVYSDYVIEKYNEVLTHTPDAKLYTETEIDLTEFIPESWGHLDVEIVADTKLTIIDLKYGKGIKVDANENNQVMIYGLGALLKHQHLYDIQKIEMIIYQPRIDNITAFTLTVDELLMWAEKELKPKAQRAYEGKGEYIPGDHCQFCKFAKRCKALADYNLKLAQHEFADADTLTDEDIANIMLQADQFKKWIKVIEDYALKEAVEKGKKWPGLKLVEGRSNRYFSDPEEVVLTLRKKLSIPESYIYKPRELKGITELTKMIGAKQFKLYLDPLTVKPQGKPVLVSKEDKRPEFNSLQKAQEDFADEE